MSDLTVNDISFRVRSVIASVFNVKIDDLHSNTRFVEDLGADSLDKISLLMMLEDEFGNTISDKDALTLTTIDSVYQYISKQNKPEHKNEEQ